MNDTSKTASPYAPHEPTGQRPAQFTDRTAKPTPTPEEMKAFMDKAAGIEAGTIAKPVAPEATGDTIRVIDPTTGEIKEEARDKEVVLTAATLQKVAAFLDPKTNGPLNVVIVRHKAFVMRIPTQQEILDVTSVIGAPIGAEMTQAQTQWSIVGELKKACYGYVGEQSPEFQVLRANIMDPTQWPPLKPLVWTESRDPYLFPEEILPLWEKYLQWRNEVLPTREEIDFYWANQR
jgi:hypothetical protein